MTTTRACTRCGNNIDTTTLFCPSCGVKQTSDEIVSPHSGVTAWVLCIFFGFLGAHRFYVGKIFTGILMLFTFGGLGIWFVYDYYSIPCRNFTDAQGRYLECRRNQVLPIIMACFSGFIVLFYIALFTLIGMIGFTESQIKDVVRKQFTAIQENNIDEAYSFEASSAMSASDFSDFIKQHPEFNQSRSIKFPDSKYNTFESKEAKIEAQLVSPTGEKTTVHYELEKQNAKWKIVKTEVNPVATQDAKPAATPASEE